MTHVTAAGVAVAFINWLKSNSSPLTAWISKEKPNAMRVVALATALIGALGITYTWNPAARSLTFAIPTAATMLTVGVAYIKSFVTQEIVYQVTKRPDLAAFIKQASPNVRNISGGAGPVQGQK